MHVLRVERDRASVGEHALRLGSRLATQNESEVVHVTHPEVPANIA